MTASQAVIGYGTILQLSNAGSPATYTGILEIRSISPPDIERDMIEVTHNESPGGWKEFLGGMIDGGEVGIELNFLPGNATHKDMLANLVQQTVANVFRPYRIVFPDYGASSYTVTVSSGTFTTGSTHGWNTPQPIAFSTSGALPTTSPQIVAGVQYWAVRASGTTFTLYPTQADAIAATNQITGGSGGSGTHNALGGSVCTFTGAFKTAKPTGSVTTQLGITATLKVTGKPVVGT